MAGVKSSIKRSKLLLIWISVGMLLILAVVISLAVALSRPKRDEFPQPIDPKPAVILPLYIYPSSSSTWSPLYTALEEHPGLDFVVIVNPNSGPGPSQFPDSLFSAELQKLNAYPNVQTVGYVHTLYATRNITEVISDVMTYAGWASPSYSGNLAIDGIFFDEAPYQYSAAAVEYMSSINAAVKSAAGLAGNRLVVHNPGTIPDSRFNDANTDITIVFEDSYAAFPGKMDGLTALPKRRSEYGLLVHSLPAENLFDLREFVNQLSQIAQYLFITSNDSEFYHSFGNLWSNFTDVMGR